MNEEIQFGDFREAPPKTGLPPDKNPHYATAWVGSAVDGMPVFVDLDTMRALELHSQSNVAVELGGVLLGERCLTESGQPFVTVQDSLPAEHYEATRGSFKFTHETWQAITRRREQFPPHLEMVGWYHTHPDWSVFLSSMDMFICDHFFNGPLDLALVIDPIRDDRGWFVWEERDGKREIQRTPGFYLFAHRGRSQELQLVAETYNEVIAMQTDPRFRTASQVSGGGVPVVHLHERPLSAGMLALAGIAAVQLLLLIWILARTVGGGVGGGGDVAQLETRLAALGEQQAAVTRAATMRELLIALAEKQPQEQGLVDRWAHAMESNSQLRAALTGYSALAEKLNEDIANSSNQLSAVEKEKSELNDQLKIAQDKIQSLRESLAAKEQEAGKKADDASTAWQRWLYWTFAGAAVLGIGVAGFFVGRRSAVEQWGNRTD